MAELWSWALIKLVDDCVVDVNDQKLHTGSVSHDRMLWY